MAARFRLAGGLALLLFALDQAVKAALLYGLNLKADPRIIEVLPFFNLVMVWNPGVSFGLFPTDGGLGRALLIGLQLGIVCVLLWWLRDTRRLVPTIAIAAVIGGAFGNIVDRILYGAVADFFDFHLFGYHWYAFNIADSAIVLGVATLVLDSLFDKTDEEAAAAARNGVDR